MLKRLSNLHVGDRLAIVLAVGSGLLLTGLIVAWLTINTRTAILNEELDQLTKQNNETTDEVNRMWTQIGEVTTQQNMEQRARQAGFRPPDKTEYLLPATVTVTLTATVTK